MVDEAVARIPFDWVEAFRLQFNNQLGETLMPSSSPFRPAALLQPIALALAALTAALAPSAQAGVVVQTASFKAGGSFERILPFSDLPWGKSLSDAVGGSRTLAFDRFDASLGRLVGASWKLEDTLLSFNVTHLAGAISYDPFSLISMMELNTDTRLSLNVGGPALKGTVLRSFNPLAGARSRCVNDPLIPLSALSCVAEAKNLFNVPDGKIEAGAEAFVGVGTFLEELNFELEWTDRVDLGLSGIGKVPLPPVMLGATPAARGRYDLAGSLSLTYFYEEVVPPAGVPEPGTLWMVAGLLPLLVLRGRRHGR